MADASKIQPDIGTLVYIVQVAKNVCVPAKIIEKITRETTAGAKVSYILDFGEPSKNNVSYDDLSDTQMLFSSEEAYNVLHENAKGIVKTIVQRAVENAGARFGKQ